MSERTAKLLALTATFMGVSVIAYRSIKQHQPFDIQAMVGVALWGGLSLLLASFAPDLAGISAGLLAVDIAVLPSKSGGSTFAQLLGSFLAPGQVNYAGNTVSNTQLLGSFLAPGQVNYAGNTVSNTQLLTTYRTPGGARAQ